jgi:hypothetical protein
LQPVDEEWEMKGRPLDVPRSRHPSDYGRPLQSIDDWSRASEMLQHDATTSLQATQHPWTLSEVAQPQRWTDTVNHANAAHEAQHKSMQRQQQQLTAAINQPLPVNPGDFLEKAPEEKQPIIPEAQRLASIVDRERPSATTVMSAPTTTIEATKEQTPMATVQSHTVTSGQILVVSV